MKKLLIALSIMYSLYGAGESEKLSPAVLEGMRQNITSNLDESFWTEMLQQQERAPEKASELLLEDKQEMDTLQDEPATSIWSYLVPLEPTRVDPTVINPLIFQSEEVNLLPTEDDLSDESLEEEEVLEEGQVQAQNLPGDRKRKSRQEKLYICDLCEKVFTQKSGLKRHTLTVHAKEKTYKCEQCDYATSDPYSLTGHKRTHTGEKPYQCDQCDKAFTFSSNLKEHKRIHTEEKPYECDVCKKAFTQSSALKIHKGRHSGEKPYRCDQCEKAFRVKSDLKRHTLTVHAKEKTYKCDQCDYATSSSDSLTMHKRTHTGEKPYTCDICNKAFTNPGSLRRHKKIHASQTNEMELTEAEIVDAVLSQVEPDIVPVQSRETAEIQPIEPSDAVVSNLEYVSEKTKLPVQSQRADQATSILCYPISTVPTQAGEIIPNSLIDQNEVVNLSPTENDLSDESLAVLEKGQIADQELPREHKRKRTGENADKCDYATGNSSSLKLHKRTNTGELFKCDQCRYATTSSSARLEFHKKIHTGQTNERVVKENAIADATMSQGHVSIASIEDNGRACVMMQAEPPTLVNNLESEKVEHSVQAKMANLATSLLPDLASSAPQEREMSVTNSFRRQGDETNIRYKMSVAFLVNERELEVQQEVLGRVKDQQWTKRLKRKREELRPYICDQCSKAFTRSGDLNQHKRIHTGEKPFKCDQCNYVAAQRGHLARHTLICHTQGKSYTCDQCNKAFTVKGDLKRHTLIVHLQEKPYKCDQCDYATSSSDSLIVHKRTHTGDKPYKCDQCDKAYTHSNSLKRHKRTHTRKLLT
jgi:KRAB domain-containing zinc finger protein